MTTTCIWDTETGPLPWSQLEEFFEPPAGPGEFDPGSVKLGQIKDLDKIDAKVRQARANHTTAALNHTEKVEAAKAEFVGRAALDATTGMVLAVGLLDARSGEPLILGDGQAEAGLIDAFWANFANKTSGEHRCMIGFNVFGFDLPFLVRRSWAVGVPIPAGLYDRKTRRWSPSFLDLAEVYRLGVYGSYIKLDRLAAHLGVERKSGSGAEFAGLWESDREAAIEYLKQDLLVTEQVAEKLGVI